MTRNKSVAPLGTRGGGGRIALGDTLKGVTPEGKKFVGKFTKNSGQTRSVGQVKKVRVTPSGGDTRVKSIKVTVMSKKGHQFFCRK